MICNVMNGVTGKVLQFARRCWIYWTGLDLTRAEWQKKRKKMASRAGQVSGRVR
jgi:hypothetical protein